MFIHYPNYTHRIPTVNLGILFRGAYTKKNICVSLHGVLYSGGGAYIRNFTVF